ncbi:facilitated trehalose transporter Tret1-like isoform X2 [Rhynchophorus ferrugineus]
MQYGWPTTALPKLLGNETYIHISDDQGSWLVVITLTGSCVGALLVGTTVDYIGRKRTIILTSLPFFFSWILTALTKSVVILYIARFIAGIADGLIFTPVSMYIAEMSNPKIRGRLASAVVSFWIFGTLLENISGIYLSIKTAALLSSILPILAALTMWCFPESPYYLLMKGRRDDAREALIKFQRTPDVEDELRRLSEAVKEQSQNGGKFLDLFTVKSNRKAALIMVILRGAQQFSGVTAIMFYAQQIFIEAESTISSELSTILYFSVKLLISIFCSGVVDRTGRRPLLFISLIGASTALFVEGTFFYVKLRTDIDTKPFSFVPVVGLISYVVIFSLGMQSIPLIILGELFPTNVKAFAMSSSDIYFNIVASIATKFFQIMKDSYGMFVPFYTFGCICLSSFVLIYLMVPETKGKTLEDIQSNLKQNNH